jgi:hypothetical protein
MIQILNTCRLVGQVGLGLSVLGLSVTIVLMTWFCLPEPTNVNDVARWKKLFDQISTQYWKTSTTQFQTLGLVSTRSSTASLVLIYVSSHGRTTSVTAKVMLAIVSALCVYMGLTLVSMLVNAARNRDLFQRRVPNE